MKKFKNIDQSFGEAGPFEAESREQLADEMMPTFELWAKEAEVRGETGDADALIKEMRENFINALEEVVP